MPIADLVLVVAALLILIGALQPASRVTGLPFTVLLAIVGIVIGAGASWLLRTELTDAFNDVAILVLELPISSQIFLNVFLPILLFQGAITIDVRRMATDMAPILFLAVVAVLVSTLVAGVALAAVSPMPLIVCLLIGSIIATTDPSAVIAIFRELGAPARLTRLVEGESLLNDATAIAVFSVLFVVVVRGGDPDYAQGISNLLISLIGGGVAGVAAGLTLAAVLSRLRLFRLAQVTLTMATPYLVYVLADRYVGVSGVVAVVVAGLVLSAVGRSRFQPEAFRFLDGVLEQSAFWASSLIFVLAAILVPRLMSDMGLADVAALVALIVAALGARALVLFGFLPLLSMTRLTQAVTTPFKTVILWGGLRGAVTLALALAVTENRFVSDEVQRFVAIQATGFVLFTLLVQGTTLKALIRRLRLDRLGPVDQALRHQVLSLALGTARDRIKATAGRYDLDDALVQEVVAPYTQRIKSVADANRFAEDIADRDRLIVGLIALANQERELVIDQLRYGGLANSITDRILFSVEQMRDGARTEGRLGYVRAARRRLQSTPTFRIANWLHMHLGIERFVARRLGERFQTLLSTQILLQELHLYIDFRLRGLLGDRLADLLQDILTQRTEEVERNLDALRLQYPSFAVELQRGFLERLAYREELDEIDELRDTGVIGAELHDDLRGELERVHHRMRAKAQVDLKLPSPDLIRSFPLFEDLPDPDMKELVRRLRPRVVAPNTHIVRTGDPPDGLYLISSGAVEIDIGDKTHRLGRGDFFGEMALLNNRRREGEVKAISYGYLFFLSREDFDRLSRNHPGWHTRIADIAAARERMNRGEEEAPASEAVAEAPAAPEEESPGDEIDDQDAERTATS